MQYPTKGGIGTIALTLIVYVVYHDIGMKRWVLARTWLFVPAGCPAGSFRSSLFSRSSPFFITPSALALRRFGNMFADHSLTAAVAHRRSVHDHQRLVSASRIAGAGSYVMAFFLTIFEILIGFTPTGSPTSSPCSRPPTFAGSLVDEH